MPRSTKPCRRGLLHSLHWAVDATPSLGDAGKGNNWAVSDMVNVISAYSVIESA